MPLAAPLWPISIGDGDSLSDGWHVFLDFRRLNTEKNFYMPHRFMVASPTDIPPTRDKRIDFGLAEYAAVLACLNNP